MNGTERQVLLSLAMIVRDGGTDLGRSLASAAPLVDEMVVVDTGSRDASREVARSAGARVVDHVWRDDFADARNAGLACCRGRWIFVLDADEMLAPQDASELKQWLIAQDNEDFLLGAMLITRHYQPAGNLRDWQPVPANDPHALPQGPPAPGFVPTRVVRIFPNRPEIRYEGCVHEMVDRSLVRAGGRMIELEQPVHHFGYLVPSPEKLRRNQKLARRKIQHDPQDHQAWSELADCCQNLDDREGCLQALEQASKLRPDMPVYRLKAGLVHYAAGSLPEAGSNLCAVVTHPQTGSAPRAEAHHTLGLIALRQGRLAEAGRHLQQALKLDPTEGRYWNGLGAWYLLGRKGEEARQALARAQQLLPGHADPLLNLGILYEAAGQTDLARNFYRQALNCDPACHEARRRLNRLARTLPIA